MKYLILSLLTLVSLTACTSEEPAKTGIRKAGTPAPSHEGPHGGMVLEAGAHIAHLETVHDEKAGTMTIYVLGGDIKTPMPIEKAPELKLMTEDGPKVVSTVAQDAKDGKASIYIGTDDLLKVHLLKGRLSVEINGKTYNPDLAHKPH